MSESVLCSDGEGDATTNHQAIQRWAAARDATPARARADGDGALRFQFPDTTRFTRLSWAEFFETFEREELAFVYDPPVDDDASRFYKFVSRETI